MSGRSRLIHMTSQTHGQTGAQVFVFNCGIHYLIGLLVVGNKMNRLQGYRLEFYVIMYAH